MCADDSIVRLTGPEAAGSICGFIDLLGPFSGEVSSGPRELTAVKIHPGEEGNTSFIGADVIAGMISAMDLPADRTFLTDTTVLYSGRRMTGPDCSRLAAEHGFRVPATPPFMVADGLRGRDEVLFGTPAGFQADSARLARLICDADLMVVVSHFKAHLLSGFGGALKNLGMGCASRAGKLWQHSSVNPVLVEERCTGCGVCAVECPEGAISVEGIAVRKPDICTGCGECLGRCPESAWRVSWDQNMRTFMRRMTEYAWAVTRAARPVLYINAVTDIVPDCDCMADTGAPLAEDVGFAASTDPVALDQACLDLVTGARVPPGSPLEGRAGPGVDKFRAFRPGIDGTLQLEMAESLGIGSRMYTLVRTG